MLSSHWSAHAVLAPCRQKYRNASLTALLLKIFSLKLMSYWMFFRVVARSFFSFKSNNFRKTSTYLAKFASLPLGTRTERFLFLESVLSRATVFDTYI